MKNIPDYEVLPNLFHMDLDLEGFRQYYTDTLPPHMYCEETNTLTVSGAQTLALLTNSDVYLYSLPNLLSQVKALKRGESMLIGGITTDTFDSTVRVLFSRAKRKVSITKNRKKGVTTICDTTNQ